MMNQQLTTLIFDLGGVLIDWNPRYLYRKLFDTEEEVENFLSQITTMEWNEEQDGGRSIETGTRILIKRYPEYREKITAYYSRWEEMLGGPITATVNLLDKLRKQNKYRILALTNWSAETFPIAQSRYDFLNWFEGIVVSGEEHLKKPDPAIYQLLLERYQIVSSEALFIDDNLRNIEAARLLGIQSLHYQSSHLLRKQLIESGISFA